MEKKQFDVVALGELLVDFTDNGPSTQGNTLFEANPGGAPCNVLAMLNKLDRSCAFVGKVGEDMFGHLLRDVAAEAGICMDYLVFDEAVRTTLAFVKTFPNGDPPYIVRTAQKEPWVRKRSLSGVAPFKRRHSSF